MKDNQSWSLCIGQWGDVSLRVHMFLLLAIVCLFGAEWNPGAANTNLFAGTAMATTVALLLAAGIHQFAHIFAVHNLGCEVEETVLMPWGGSCVSDLPDSRASAIVAYSAGVFANAMLFLVGGLLLMQTSDVSLWNLVNPFRPNHFDLTVAPIAFLKIFTWMNFQLMWINFIPCFPFDAVKIIRAAIANCHIDTTKSRIETAIMLIGHAVAFAMIGVGGIWMFKGFEPGIGLMRPGWLFLMCAGTLLFFAARYSMYQESQDRLMDGVDESLAYDFVSRYETSSFYDFSDIRDDSNMAYSQWLNEKQLERQDALQKAEEDLEQEEDLLADEILIKLHGKGGDLTSLNDFERSVLQRFSERVRRRRQETV